MHVFRSCIFTYITIIHWLLYTFFTVVLMEYIEFLLQVRIKLSEPSVKVKEDWRVIEEIDFSRLAKLSLPSYGEPVDL